MDKKDLLSQVSDPEVMKQVTKISEINRKEKRGDLSKEEAAEQVVDIAEEHPQLREILGMIMQNFSHGDVAEEIKKELVDRFGEDWEETDE